MSHKLNLVDVSLDTIALELGLEQLASRRLFNDV
jgi:hypothetical protein